MNGIILSNGFAGSIAARGRWHCGGNRSHSVAPHPKGDGAHKRGLCTGLKTRAVLASLSPWNIHLLCFASQIFER